MGRMTLCRRNLQSGVDVSGGMVAIEKEEVVLKEYDPAEGVMLCSAF